MSQENDRKPGAQSTLAELCKVTTPVVPNQLRLFKLENPLKHRIGTDFFKLLPKDPGVYWMLDGRGRLLYVGKSRNLKQRLSSYRSLRPENLPERLVRLLLGTEHIGFECTDSEPRALQVEAELLRLLKPPCNRAGVGPARSYDWIVREMPRSWRLEVQTRESRDPMAGFRSAPRVFKAHGAILRQLHGLTHGRFSILALPTALLKGPAGAQGNFVDRDMDDELAGPSFEEKRMFNLGLRETVQMFLDGVEPWPEFPCPTRPGETVDRWSFDLWQKDFATLTDSFENFVRPFRMKQVGLTDEDLEAAKE